MATEDNLFTQTDTFIKEHQGLLKEKNSFFSFFSLAETLVCFRYYHGVTGALRATTPSVTIRKISAAVSLIQSFDFGFFLCLRFAAVHFHPSINQADLPSQQQTETVQLVSAVSCIQTLSTVRSGRNMFKYVSEREGQQLKDS